MILPAALFLGGGGPYGIGWPMGWPGGIWPGGGPYGFGCPIG
jgi:hypothetical protein